MDILQMTALELGKAIKEKKVSAVEATQAVFQQIHKKESQYGCYISLFEQEALARAKEVQKEIENGVMLSPIAGVPMAIKDNICTKGKTTTCGSKMLEHFKPFYSATVMEKLEHAGAILIGKTNMDEFAMGSTSESSYFQITKNPWNTAHVPGGSSGGSAAAVTAGEAFFALGSDTGGSIRQPASYCGITGLKPTYGTVSRYGLVAYASSLDQIGPLAKDVADTTAIYQTIRGYDKKDATSVKELPWDTVEKENIKGCRIGIPLDFIGEGTSEDVKSCIYETAKRLSSLGAEVEECDLKEIRYSIPTYYIIACAEASSNLARYDGIKYGYSAKGYTDLTDLYYRSRGEGFGKETKKRILIGTFVLSSGYYDAYYKKALQVKALIKKAYDDAFHKYDMLLCPAAPTTAPKIGSSLKDPLKMYLSDICTVSVNLAGLPGLVFPCGFDKKGLPVGAQLIGKPFHEQELLQTAQAFQNVTDFHCKRPKSVEKEVE